MLTRSLLSCLLILPASARAWETLSGDSAIKEPRRAAVTTQPDWEALWAEHAPGTPPPEVDFSGEMVVAVFLGEKPTSGWAVELEVRPIPGMPGAAVASYAAVPPLGMAAQMVSAPFLMRKAAKAQTVEFQLVAAPQGSGEPAPVEPSKTRLKKFLDGEWYASWGYNKDYWAPTDMHVSQPALGNDFTIHGLRAHDTPGWDTGVFNKQPTVPQYNVRVGRFIDKKRTWAVELSFDHTKYTSTVPQQARVSGTIGGKPVDQTMTLDDKTFWYNLHNGANHVTLNVVKRLPLVGRPEDRFSVAGLAKGGVGFMLPHADNAVFGDELDLGPKAPGNWFGKHQGWWQVDGVTAGLEAGVRVTVFRPFYLEFTDKVAYSRMSDVPVYKGTAKHDLWMNELILSAGFTINAANKKGR